MNLFNEKLFLSLQEISKLKLLKLFNINKNLKHVILEDSLIKQLEHVCGGVHWLKNNGIDKIFKLEDTLPICDDKPLFFIIFSSLKIFHKVINQIRSKINNNNYEKIPHNKFHIIIIPKSLYIFEKELEELGLFDPIIKLHSFQWMPLLLDNTVLSMELPLIYESLFINKDLLFISNLSNILWELLIVIGQPKFILTLGQLSNILLKKIDLFNDNKGKSDNESYFGGLIIIDRNIDYPSALLTPGIYSGLLKETYTIETNNESLIADKKFNLQNKRNFNCFNLNSSEDIIYADIKNRYFTEVTTVLNNLTKELKNEIQQSKKMNLADIKKYVETQLKATKLRKKMISNHFAAAEIIINVIGPRFENQKSIESNIIKNINKNDNLNYLNELLLLENDKLICLRLLCLLCCTQKLSDNEIKQFWKKFLHHFGFHYGYAYKNLINCGFISCQTKKLKISKFPSLLLINNNNFYQNATKLKQIPLNPEKINLKEPTCGSYVFGGNYIPLITQITNMLLNSVPIDDIKLKLENFGLLDIKNNQHGYPIQKRTILIFIIGGVTFAEITACNLLQTLTASKIVILSDNIISGNDLMKKILQKNYLYC